MRMNLFTDADELCGVYFIYVRKSTKAVMYTAALIFLMGLLMAAFLPASVCPVHMASSLLCFFSACGTPPLNNQCLYLSFPVLFFFLSCVVLGVCGFLLRCLTSL